MSSRAYARAKGSTWERECAEYLRPVFPQVERAPRWGANDKGDLTGTGIFTVEAKNCKAITLSTFMDEAKVEANNVGPGQIPVVFIKRKGKGVAEGYAVTTIEHMSRLMHLAWRHSQAFYPQVPDDTFVV